MSTENRRQANILCHLPGRLRQDTGLDISNTSATTKHGEYQYTLNVNGILTAEQRDFYEKNGFILIKGLVSQGDLEKYRQRFLKIANGEVRRTATMTVMRDVAIAKQKQMGEAAITKLQDWQEDEELFSYCKHPDVVKYVEAFIGPDVRSVHTMLINKPPDVGVGSSRHPLHQDLWYFPFRPADRIVASWTAMQHIDKTNGCLVVIPGSHRKGELYKHEYPSDGIVNKAYHGIQGLSNENSAQNQLVDLIMEPGDTVFFHPLLVHGSGRNNSSGYRKAISCHFASSTLCSFIEVHGTMQEDIAREIEHMLKNKGLQGVSFNDLWRLKSRYVKGAPGTSFVISPQNAGK